MPVPATQASICIRLPGDRRDALRGQVTDVDINIKLTGTALTVGKYINSRTMLKYEQGLEINWSREY